MPDQDNNQNSPNPTNSQEMNQPPSPPLVEEDDKNKNQSGKDTLSTETTKVDKGTDDVPPPPTFTTSPNQNSLPPEPPQASPSTPDVISTSGSNSSGRSLFNKKTVAAFLGVLLIVGGVISGLILVQRQQDIREQAGSIGGLGCTSPKGILVTSQSSPGNPGDLGYKPIPNTYNIGETVNFRTKVKNTSSRQVTDQYHFFGLLVTEAPRGQTPAPNLTENQMYEIHGDPSRGTKQETKYNSGNQEFTLSPGEEKYLTASWTPTECGYYQIDMGVMDFLYVDRNNTTNSCQFSDAPDDDAVVAAGFIKVVGCDTQTRPTPTPTPGAGGGPSVPPQGGACLDIKAYDLQNNELGTQELSSLKPGDKVKFVVSGGTTAESSFDKARFRIITGQTAPAWNEVTDSDGGSTYYYIYTIPENAETFRVEAQIHHTVSGWL